MKDAVCKEWTCLREDDGKGVMFYCAGCDCAHHVVVDSGIPGRDWTWNNDVVKPTFNPSVLVSYDYMSAAGRAKHDAFKAVHGRYPTHAELPYDARTVCHSFVRDGFIQYLGDCTHRLANNTVPLLAYEHWYSQDA